MVVETLKDQWICSCGNWVDLTFDWCPDCCKEKFIFSYDASRHEEVDTTLSH